MGLSGELQTFRTRGKRGNYLQSTAELLTAAFGLKLFVSFFFVLDNGSGRPFNIGVLEKVSAYFT